MPPAGMAATACGKWRFPAPVGAPGASPAAGAGPGLREESSAVAALGTSSRAARSIPAPAATGMWFSRAQMLLARSLRPMGPSPRARRASQEAAASMPCFASFRVRLSRARTVWSTSLATTPSGLSSLRQSSSGGEGRQRTRSGPSPSQPRSRLQMSRPGPVRTVPRPVAKGGGTRGVDGEGESAAEMARGERQRPPPPRAGVAIHAGSAESGVVGPPAAVEADTLARGRPYFGAAVGFSESPTQTAAPRQARAPARNGPPQQAEQWSPIPRGQDVLGLSRAQGRRNPDLHARVGGGLGRGGARQALARGRPPRIRELH